MQVHLIFHDYSSADRSSPYQFRSTISLNASVFAAVLLASRCPTRPRSGPPPSLCLLSCLPYTPSLASP